MGTVMPKNSFFRTVLKLPLLTLIGVALFVIFLIYAVAAGIVAAATEFSAEFSKVFTAISGILVIVASIVLIVAGIVLHMRANPSKRSRATYSKESAKPAPPKKEPEVVENEPVPEPEAQGEPEQPETEAPAEESKPTPESESDETPQKE